jgi:lipopolysaccharide transport system ATP-binding protein
MERVIFDGVWKQYDRHFGSNRFRRLAQTLFSRHPERNEFWALRDVSFRMQEGCSLGIVGPNGSGKTTILRILSGITHIDRGHLRVRGTIAALIALGAGFHPELTGRENIYLNGSILGLSRAEIRSYFDDIVEFANIGEYIDSPVKRYSSGMFVRLGFAVASRLRPDVLLVDEVLAVGDARFQSRCHERINELRKDGTVIILISHDLWAIRHLCQQGLFLNKGVVEAYGPVTETIAAYTKHVEREGLDRVLKAATTDLLETGAACDIEFIDEHGDRISEVAFGESLRMRFFYRCDRPVERPVLVVQATAHNGPCAMTLRSNKENAEWDTLSGEGHIDVTVEDLRLNPGRYAMQCRIKGQGDMVEVASSRFRELFVRPPHIDWAEEDANYLPRAVWSTSVHHADRHRAASREKHPAE